MESMLADHFTKPLQGSLFKTIWSDILNLPELLYMVWEGSKSECNEMLKLHRVDYNPIPHECVAKDES